MANSDAAPNVDGEQPDDAAPSEDAVDQVLQEIDPEDVTVESAPPEDPVSAANDRALRAQAELENFRKRARREIEDERRYAKLPLIRDLLVVIDNLNRAIEAAGEDAGASGLVQGVHMAATQFESVLAQHQCVPIEAMGLPFDPNLHEAMSQETSDEHDQGSVCRVIQKGYRIHERVVRPAQVFVSTGPANDPAE